MKLGICILLFFSPFHNITSSLLELYTQHYSSCIVFQCSPTLTFFFFTVDIISAIEFDKSGEHLATGDRGGRVVLFERTDAKDVSLSSFMICQFDEGKIIVLKLIRWTLWNLESHTLQSCFDWDSTKKISMFYASVILMHYVLLFFFYCKSVDCIPINTT